MAALEQGPVPPAPPVPPAAAPPELPLPPEWLPPDPACDEVESSEPHAPSDATASSERTSFALMAPAYQVIGFGPLACHGGQSGNQRPGYSPTGENCIFPKSSPDFAYERDVESFTGARSVRVGSARTRSPSSSRQLP